MADAAEAKDMPAVRILQCLLCIRNTAHFRARSRLAPSPAILSSGDDYGIIYD